MKLKGIEIGPYRRWSMWEHAAVNMYPGPVHTARHTLGVDFARSIRPRITLPLYKCSTSVAHGGWGGLIGAYHGGVFDWGEVVTR